MRNLLLQGLAAGALAAATFGASQTPPAAPFPVHQLTPAIYWVEGSRSNSGVIVGEHGVIVIDTQISPDAGKELLGEIAKITPKPITTVILTHSDLDHIGGLPVFPKGITIIAQENCKKEMEAAIASHAANAPSPDSLPTQLVTRQREDLTIDSIKLELLHTAPAHTSGDLIIYLPEQKIAFAGDILTMTRARPLIHAEKGGSSEGWISMAKALMGLDTDIYVPGHGNAAVTKPVIQKRIDDLVAERNQIKELIAQGKSLQEIEEITGDRKPPEEHSPPTSEVIYNELTHKAK